MPLAEATSNGRIQAGDRVLLKIIDSGCVDVDAEGLEGSLLAELMTEGVRGHTIIAFAFAGAPPNGA